MEEAHSNKKHIVTSNPVLCAVLVTLVVTVLLATFAFAQFLRPTPLAVGAPDLNAVPDGSYIGVCQNKILIAVVRVDVKEHVIENIDIIAHKRAYMEQALKTARTVMENQSLEVDAISGATLTVDTVRKAIENALTADGEG